MEKSYIGNTDICQEKAIFQGIGKSYMMMGMTRGERIKKRLKDLNISSYRLASLMEVKPASVYAWLENKGPKRDKMKQLAEILKCRQEWLEFGTGVEELKESPHGVEITTLPIKQVPLISWVTAGQWAEVSDNYPPGHGEDIIPCPAKCGPHSFALRVKGDSMSPDYPDGSVIVVDPGREPRHDSDVVVRLNSDMEATFKRLKIDGSRWYLHPLNERYPVISLEGKDFTICGVVVWTGREVG